MRGLLTEASFTKVVFWLFLLFASGAFAADEQAYAVVRDLQRGGYVIFIRHAGTNHDIKDTDIRDLNNCATQRNLAPYGREQSQMIGDAFKALNIPVGDILSSQYCRCMDTAKVAFGRATAVPTLSSYVPVPAAEKRLRVELLRKLLNTPPGAGGNTVVVSHHDMFRDASGGLDLAEGEAVVFKPNNVLGPQFIARVRAEGWKNLVAQRVATTD